MAAPNKYSHYMLVCSCQLNVHCLNFWSLCVNHTLYVTVNRWITVMQNKSVMLETVKVLLQIWNADYCVLQLWTSQKTILLSFLNKLFWSLLPFSSCTVVQLFKAYADAGLWELGLYIYMIYKWLIKFRQSSWFTPQPLREIITGALSSRSSIWF